MKIPKDAWDEGFINKMKSRVIMSQHKYGNLKKFKMDTRNFRDELKNVKYRIKCYEETGNTEYLVDAANFLMFEFMEMKGAFIPTDNDPRSKIV